MAVNHKDAFPISLKKLNHNYKVGPLVGILTTKSSRWFRGNQTNFKDLIKTGIKYGVLIYVFTAESVDRKNKTVKGFLYLPNQNTWIVRKMPLPDVIYNRIPSRTEENRPLVKETIEFLINENIPFFNPHFFDKWTLYKWLKESPKFNKLLPETTTLTMENLIFFLNRYPMLYLKPIDGKAGIGFFKIDKKDNLYLLRYQSSKTTHYEEFNNVKSLIKTINHLTKSKKYIIQQGIKLNTYNGNPYDFRILVQKNGVGKWALSGIGVRVAGINSITTHVPRGGHIQSVHRVTNYDKKLIDELSNIAIDISKFIEEKSENNLGELSMDIGVDQNRNIWFFEANAKPMKFDEPNIRKISLQRLIQYFRYLSGFVK
ncbi:hypothetical protein BHF71_06340 [Vulcanibacillus modesticaldus]|uniref:ATP-grasp domain-containing protein n=2 Tax=Vulcanibacillus modesticaldus TaxID=337097 RepID=A0A1D2YWK9_9BACI|nr:hypothetical protein BHF71_06340 [Vulcanibacillus modesticaldus]